MPGQKLLIPILFLNLLAVTVSAQQGATGVLRGTVRILPSATVARNAIVTIAELKRSVMTNDDGTFEFDRIPAGKYQVIFHLDRVPEVVKSVTVSADAQTLDVQLVLAPVSEQVTVTVTGSAEDLNLAYQSVDSVGALELAQKNTVSIGEALDYQLGVAKRSFGPGSGRPVIRGFDGDRVLVLQDGQRVGGIASQSGDEVEPIDILALDRLEIVKGPATLLYGSNAMGGVVNGISTNSIFQNGLSGYLTAFGGNNNWQGGGSGGFKYGFDNFMVFGNAGALKANDYRTPLDIVLNSFARVGNVSGGAGWFPRKGWLSFNYAYDRRRHGLPVEPDEVDFESLHERRHSYEIKGGLRELKGFIQGLDFGLRYNDYKVREFEFESDENVTELEATAFNRNFNYRANFDHRRYDKFSGTFGFSGFTRDFESVGEEAPAPRTQQHSVSVYGLERIDFEHAGIQLGARLEQNGYDPTGNLPDRNFIGFSGSAGVRLPLWTGGAVVANYQHSFRAPALEELYNHGPHPGILLFDIGNPQLEPEQADAIDFTLRHNTNRLRLEGSVYYYKLRNFVFPALTGETDEESSLPIANYMQGNARYIGTEAKVEAKLRNAIWVNAQIDYTRAELTDSNKPLPRIPPLRGAVGLQWSYKAFRLEPEVLAVNKQVRVFDNETPTAGYVLFNANASYTIVRDRLAHVFSISGYNLTDVLYRNHLSFIKEIAPDIGRNFRLTYTLRY
jgi:iron complex outermembrane receptor protein